jgi:diguanylate cyclase (GGDEF)-like protein
MNSPDSGFDGELAGRIPDDLRRQIHAVMQQQLGALTADAVAIFPYSGDDPLEPDYCEQIAHLLAQLLATAVRDGRVETQVELLDELQRIVQERPLPISRLFTFTYFIERTTLDELALDEEIGATSDAWPLVAQLVRRGSFDVLAAYADRGQVEPAGAPMVDRLTTLYSAPLLKDVLIKEAETAGRHGDTLSLIVFDVDNLGDINQKFGYGVGDKVLERLGILVRTYFRQNDWVARLSEDSIAVLLTRTDADQAADLAEQVRRTVADRLWFLDHRTERNVPVTVSGAIVNVAAAPGTVIDPERLLADTEAAIERAKRHGRNRVERVDSYASAQQSRLPEL